MTDLMVPHGLYFEDYAVGQSLMTQGRTISEADVVNFAALSGDWNSIHTNAVYAADGMFGERIAHGLLGLSIASGLAERTGLMRDTVIAFMGLDWKFKGAIKLGDTVTARLGVAECREMRRLGGGIITFDVELLNQRSEIVQRGTWSMLVKSRPAEA
jgi:3-hydroxybutyryl-CoA dehydratase